MVKSPSKNCVLNRSRRCLRAKKDVFRAKVNELSANDKLQTPTQNRPFKLKLKNLESRDSCFRRSNHRDERNKMLK